MRFTDAEKPPTFRYSLPEHLKNGDIIFDRHGEPQRVSVVEKTRVYEDLVEVPICQVVAKSDEEGTLLVRANKSNFIRPLNRAIQVKVYAAEDLIAVIEHQMASFVSEVKNEDQK